MAIRYVVLGFRTSAGGYGFALTSNPLVYLLRTRSGEYRSSHVGSAAELKWAIPQPSHEFAMGLRDQLNGLSSAAAAALARSQSVDSRSIARLKQLAERSYPQHAEDGAVEPTAIAAAWDLVPPLELPDIGRSRIDRNLDDPFSPLPDRWRHPSPTQRTVPADLPVRLVVFDLDGTLVDSTALDQLRRDARITRDWGAVRHALPGVRPLRAWGGIAPHQLPGLFRESGYRVAILSRAPRWYVDAIVEEFAIETDEIEAGCGSNKMAGLGRVIRRAGLSEAETWVFGDDEADFRAADNLGCWHFGNLWASRTASAGVAPDVAWFDAAALLESEGDWLDLRYVGELPDPAEAAWHRGSLLPFGDGGVALGRYYKARHRRHHDRLSQSVLEAKDTGATHPVLEAAFSESLAHLGASVQVDVVASIPPRSGEVDRFARYRHLACDALGARDDVCIRVLQEVPKHYKSLARQEKQALRPGRFAIDDDLSRATVLLIDDVVTTGSTLGAMSDAVAEAGASRIVPFAWAVAQS